MSRTWKDTNATRGRRRAEADRRTERKARQLSLRFATHGRVARVRVPRDLLERLEVLYR